MLGQFGWGEMLLLVVVGLFVFGPERLPSIARDAGKVLRQFRQTARSMRDDLSAELGPEVADLDLKSLNPRTFVEKHLLGEDDEDEPLSPPPARRRATSSAATTASAADVPLNKPSTRPTAAPDTTPYDGDAT